MDRTRSFFVPVLALAVAGCDFGGNAPNINPDMATLGPNVDLGPEKPGDMGGNARATTAVVTTSSLMDTGTINTVRLADKNVVKSIDNTIDQNHAVRAFGGKVYVIGRDHNTLRIYDPAGGFSMPKEVSTGAASNPEDVLAIPATSKVYVALYNADADHAIAVFDSTMLDKGIIKSIAIPKAGSPLPRVQNLYFCGPLVYAVLQDLDENWAVTGAGRIAVIDPSTDALVGSGGIIQLTGTNPGGTGQDGIAPLDPGPGGCHVVLVTDSGDFTKPIPNGGGVERVDLTRGKSDGFVVTDGDLKGSPGAVSAVSENLAYLVVNTDNASRTRVVALDPGSKKVIGDVLGPARFISFAAASPDGQLFVGVTAKTMGSSEPDPGLYVGAADGKPLMGTPITFAMGPYAIAFY